MESVFAERESPARIDRLLAWKNKIRHQHKDASASAEILELFISVRAVNIKIDSPSLF
jgi:hypothetical protein